MNPLHDALRAGLAARPAAEVAALVQQPVEVALRSFRAWDYAGPQTAPGPARRADTGVIVFDRERRAHGREDAFVRPLPADLPGLAAWLRNAGVRRLLMVMPHAPALLPQALKAGLASLDEHAVVALGFEHLVFVRPARAAARAAAGLATLQRVAHGVLSQLHFMVPQREQPLRAAKVAQFVADVARALPAVAPGSRIAAPELLWDWARPDGGDAVLQAWLAGRPPPAVTLPTRRW